MPDAALFNQQGQLTPEQRTSIGGWLSRQQLRAVPSLLPMVGLVAFAFVLESGRADLFGGGTVTLLALAIIGVAAIYALLAVRRFLALGNAKSMLNGGLQIGPRAGTVIKHGGERNAVQTDDRTWGLTASPNVCRDARPLTPGACTFYSLRRGVSMPRDRCPWGGDGAIRVGATAVLLQPGVRFARSDPDLDPGGYLTLLTAQLAELVSSEIRHLLSQPGMVLFRVWICGALVELWYPFHLTYHETRSTV